MSGSTHLLIVYLVGIIVGAICSAMVLAAITNTTSQEMTFQQGVDFVISGEREDRCNLRFKKNVTMVQGLYHHPEYFCVWTKDREPKEIAQTTFHELAHYYSYNAPNHFNVEVKN